MKKALALLLTLLMVLSLTACGASKPAQTEAPAEAAGVDLSAYPEKLEDWTGQNFIDYFKAAGVFKDGDGYETWLQDHANYWPGTPVNECAGCWDDAGTFMVMIFLFDGSNADTSEEDLNTWLDGIREKKTLPEEYMSMPVDHLVGNIGFTYEIYIQDEDAYNAMNDAFHALMQAKGVTPEF